MLCSIWEGFSIQTRDTGGNETEQPLLEPVSCSDWPRLVLHAHCDPFLHLLLFCTKLHSHSHILPFELLLISCPHRIVSPSGIMDPFVHCCKGDAICKKCHRRRHLPLPCPDIGFGTGLHREVDSYLRDDTILPLQAKGQVLRLSYADVPIIYMMIMAEIKQALHTNVYNVYNVNVIIQYELAFII